MWPSRFGRALMLSIQPFGAKNIKFGYNRLQSILGKELRKGVTRGSSSGNIMAARKATSPLSQGILSHEEERSTQTSSQPQLIPLTTPVVDPHSLAQSDMEDLVTEIKQVLKLEESVPEIDELGDRHPELFNVASYYFDGQGKAVRPLVSVLMSRAINFHLNGSSFILPAQRKLALVSEMVHTATLVHDDVIDMSNTRRGKPSVNARFGQKKAIIGGDYILAKAGGIIARLNNDEVTPLFAQILNDLVQGEFMQMGANEENSERFSHYIEKTFNKTASLMAYSCKGVAILGGADESLAEMAFQFGKNLGIAFQLIDDLLDFVSSTETMGKPAAADLELGLATAPVLYAADKHEFLNELIARRFSKDGDVSRALDAVHNSDGLEKTKLLAHEYCLKAVHIINTLTESPYQQGLTAVAAQVLHRSK